MLPSPILEKGSVGFPVQSWVKVVYVLKSNTEKGFYMFSSPILEKVSVCAPVQSWVKVVYVLKSNTGKRF